jgi:hypothetical protein
MRRALLLMQKVLRCAVPARRLVVLCFLGALGMIGIHMLPARGPAPAGPPTPTPQKGSPAPVAGEFSGMRPHAGDHMTPPRLGFRWKYALPERSAAEGAPRQASMVPPFFSRLDSSAAGREGVRFTLHLLGPGGGPEITREARSGGVRLNLKGALSPGECEWWVEAAVPGQAPVSSPRERFILTR